MRSLLVLLLSVNLVGCAYGIIYSDTTTPLVSNMDQTLAQGDSGSTSMHEFREPFTGSGLSIHWASRAIGDSAKQNSIDTIYYADQRTVSILLGLWKSTTVRVIGKKVADQ